jgi:hypothetical protein
VTGEVAVTLVRRVVVSSAVAGSCFVWAFLDLCEISDHFRTLRRISPHSVTGSRGAMKAFFDDPPPVEHDKAHADVDRPRADATLFSARGLSPHTPCRSPGALTRIAACTLARSPNRDRYSKASAISLPP